MFTKASRYFISKAHEAIESPVCILNMLMVICPGYLIVLRKKCGFANLGFQGTVARDFFASGFFHELVSPQPQSIPLGDIRKSRCTTGINDTGGAP